MSAARLRRRSPLYVLTLLWLAYTSSLVDRYLLGILGESIKRDLALSDAMLGFLSGTAFALFYATLGIPVGWLAERSNRRNLVAGAVALWSGFTIWCGLAGSVGQLALARMGVGVGEAGAGPPSQALIADLFPSEKRGSAMAFFASAVNLGMLLAFGVGGWIGEHYGWRAAFVSLGAPGLLIGALVWLTTDDPGRRQTPQRTPFVASLRRVVRHLRGEPALLHLLAGSTLAVLVASALVLWLPAFYLRTHSVSQATLGAQFGLLLGIVGALGVLGVGFLSDRIGVAARSRKAALVARLQVALWIAIGGVLLAPSHAVSLVPLAVVALLLNCFLGPTFALVQDIVSDDFRALVPAVAVFLANLIGLGLGPYFVGAVSDLAARSFPGEGLRVALGCVSLVCLLSAMHYWSAGRWLEGRTPRSHV